MAFQVNREGVMSSRMPADVNYAKGWRMVRKGDRGFFVKLGGNWYHPRLAGYLKRKVWVESYGYDQVLCYAVRGYEDLLICVIED